MSAALKRRFAFETVFPIASLDEELALVEREASRLLAQSGVREGEPGILALDEFQRFRTIDNKRADVRVERYQDVWALLSDGKLPPALSLLGDASLARERLGWVPEITAQQMCQEMVASDLAQARQSALLKRHGYPVNVGAE